MNTETERIPAVSIVLTGTNGNAFAILGKIRKAIFRQVEDRDAAEKLWDEFHAEATSGDYNHLLATAMSWFDVR